MPKSGKKKKKKEKRKMISERKGGGATERSPCVASNEMDATRRKFS